MPPIYLMVWLLGAVAIAIAGRNLRFGFWGYFFVSILLTPAIGLLMLIAAVPVRESRRR